MFLYCDNDVNNFGIILKLCFNKNKMSEDGFFFNDFEINCEHVEILMKFLAFYSFINQFYNE